MPLLTFCKYLTKEGLFIVGTGQLDAEQQEKRGSAYEMPYKHVRRPTQSMLPNMQSRAAVTKGAWLWQIEQGQLDAFIQVYIHAY